LLFFIYFFAELKSETGKYCAIFENVSMESVHFNWNIRGSCKCRYCLTTIVGL